MRRQDEETSVSRGQTLVEAARHYPEGVLQTHFIDHALNIRPEICWTADCNNG